jgi:hypothetical protein
MAPSSFGVFDVKVDEPLDVCRPVSILLSELYARQLEPS